MLKLLLLGCWCCVSEVTLICQCRTSSVTVSYYQSHIAVERTKHWQSMLLSSSVLSCLLSCRNLTCPISPSSTCTEKTWTDTSVLHRHQMLSVSHSSDRCTCQIQKRKLQCSKMFQEKKKKLQTRQSTVEFNYKMDTFSKANKKIKTH